MRLKTNTEQTAGRRQKKKAVVQQVLQQGYISKLCLWKDSLFQDSEAFTEQTFTVQRQQCFQVFDLFPEMAACVGIRDRQPPRHTLDNMNRGSHLRECVAVVRGLEGHVFGELDVVRIEDEGIACNPGLGLVGLGDAAVDDEQAAARLDRVFTIFDRHMAVDNVRMLGVKAKLLKDLAALRGVLVAVVVGVHRLTFKRFVPDKAALKGGHAVFAENRRFGAAP